MKKTLIIWLVCSSSVFAFTGSDSLLNYYPLQIGNYWEYEDKFVDLMNDTTILGYFSFSVTGDTVMPNGKLYQVVERQKLAEYEIPHWGFAYGDQFYDRIDSTTFNIYRYDSQDFDRHNDELLLDSLKFQEGELRGFSRWFGIYASIKVEEQELEPERFYCTSKKSFHANDIVTWGITYSLANGFGFVYGYFSDTTWRHTINLVYARIDGQSFGRSVSVMHEPEKEKSYRLFQNYPNPFNSTTTISFNLPTKEKVSLKIYDISGCLVKELVNDSVLAEGDYDIIWNGTDNLNQSVASGIYIYRLETANKIQNRKCTLLR